jgi:ribosomal protein L31E
VRGSLGVFNLFDLLQLLAQNQSKGCLTIYHPSQREGRVFFDSGRVTHVSYGSATDAEGLRALLRDERGNFEFIPGRSPQKPTVSAAFDNFMLEVIRELDSGTTTVEKQFPIPGELDAPRVVDEVKLSNLTLSADEFAVVERIDGERTVIAISQATNLPLEMVQRTLVRLASIGLVDVKKRAPRVARLVVGLSREMTGMEVCVDEVILRAWDRQQGRPVKRVRMRDEGGREFVFDAITTPNLGAYALFSNNAMMRYDLRANAQVLLKPEA